MAELKSSNQTSRRLTALKWNALGNTVRALVQFIIGIVLARLLGPEPFGLVAIAWIVIGLGNLIADFGLASALVQRKKITPLDIRFAFTVQIVVGLVFSFVVASLAPLIGIFFGKPNAVQVVQAMALLFVLQASGQTSAAILRRQMNFRAIQLASIGGYLTGYIAVGLPMAWAGAGVWALVVAQLTQAVITSVALYLRVRHSLQPTLRMPGGGMLAFGSGVLAGNVSSWGISNLDAAIVGKIFGVVELGLYNRTMNLVATPMNAFVSAVQSVLFSAYSRDQADIASVQRSYLASVGGVAMLLIPAFLTLAAIPQTAILGVYGEAWLPAQSLLTPLALAMPINVLLALGGPLLLGLGKARSEASVHAFSLLALAAALSWAANVSLVAVPWAVLSVYILRCFLITGLTLRVCEARWVQFAQAIAGPLIVGCFAAALAASMDHLLRNWLQNPALRLAGVLLGTCLFCAVVVLFFGRWLIGRDVVGFFAASAGRLPEPLTWCMRRWGY